LCFEKGVALLTLQKAEILIVEYPTLVQKVKVLANLGGCTAVAVDPCGRYVRSSVTAVESVC
jgi:hypothetical protein